MSFTRLFRCLLLLGALFGAQMQLRGQAPDHPGAAIYEKACAECHGRNGEGVKDEYDEPLVGERSLAALTKRIHRTMPEEDPGSLTPEEAAQVAAYIYEAFYSAAAQARLNPPKLDVARLTVPQYRTTVADLIGSFRGGFQNPPQGERGLKGRYSGRPVEKPKEPVPEDPNSGEVK